MKPWTSTVQATIATHRDVALTGNARDRRRKYRMIKRMFPLTALEAIDVRGKYVSRSRNRIVITQVALWR